LASIARHIDIAVPRLVPAWRMLLFVALRRLSLADVQVETHTLVQLFFLRILAKD